MLLRGLFTALITPFNPEGNVDEVRLRRNIRAQIRNGVDGIVLLGTTGEAPTLTESEKKQIVRIGVEEAKGKILVLVGTGSYSTDRTIHDTRLAEESGADAALVVTPYYNKPTPEGLFKHFQALTNAVRIPICLYNIQGRTALNIDTQTLLRIADLQGIIGVKEASGNIGQIDDTVHAFADRPDFSILSGDDALTLPLMALGGHGVISVASNLIVKPIKELIRSCTAQEHDRALRLHRELRFLYKGLFIETNPIPIKAAMHFFQLDTGQCRLPLCEPSRENREKLVSLFNRIPADWLIA